ncbi:chemotaxis protein CheB [Ohtaekwangia kribbensis]|jgi:two-component system CheB/CheR fusion protein|uniref:Chemotaxis protein CheB n=1 Tax=Ohtaekwangia kribbensis TaxID=688913 RepID=A0ABW3JYB5_9BACT
MAHLVRHSKHYIVGVGASAGGMEAIHDLFDNIDQHTGFSFVIIQHLSPDYKSLMVELLSKHTSMDVFEAEDGMTVQPDCIYILPRKKTMTIREGKLWLEEKENTPQPNHAIDIFFSSLAIDKGKDALAIILSGTGTDGSRGIAAVKERGGIVIVQDPQSAAFDGMPNSAIATGLVDLVLPPEIMGNEILDFLREVPLIRSMNTLTKAEEALVKDILQMLHDHTQHDFMHYKRPTLFRRLAKRMTELEIKTLKEYRDYLRDNGQELEILCKEFLINVTRFFRDGDAFECLRVEVIPGIFSLKKPGEVIKIWIAACSSGEEAYSVAILLLEHLEMVNVNCTIKVFATDIDEEALEVASRGIYSESIAADVPSNFLQKYFIKEGNTYRVSQELRKVVVFANHDILRDPPFSKLDLITCRNMFIYLTSDLQTKALKRFHFALNINSYLMLGPSENIGILKDVMHEVSRKWKVYRCLTKSRITDQDGIITPLENRLYVNPQHPYAKQVTNSMAEAFKETLIEGRKIAGFFIDREFNIKQATGSFKHFMQLPDDHFNFNLLKLVRPGLAVTLGICVRKALAKNERMVMRHVLIPEDTEHFVNITVKPFYRQPDFSFLCVVLEEEAIEGRVASAANLAASDYERVAELERELKETRENLQSIIEETETTNEELQSSNEELISTNEELQSTNEELQSLNEELHTVSGEHQLKIKELLELNDDLSNYFTNSGIGQILIDKKFTIRRFSPAVKQVINLIESDIGRSIMDITTNLTDIDFIDCIRQVIAEGKSIQKEVRLVNNSYYSVRITPYLRHTREKDGVVINLIDITESKKLSSIIEGVFHSSTSGVMAYQAVRNEKNEIADFQCIVANETADRILGARFKPLVGKRLYRDVRDFEDYIATYVQVVETGDAARFEFNKDDRWYDVVVVRMLDGVVTTFNDVTDKKRAADVAARSYHDLQSTSQKLVESNKLLERSNFDLLQFASVASHDLKEPLRKIQAFGNILQSKIEDKLSESELNYLTKIVSASTRMQTLIEDVLTLSKLSNRELYKEKTDLNRIVRRICDDLDITITEKNAEITVGTLPIINAVPGQMRQLFQNLLTNALKFSNKDIPRIIIEEHAITDDMATDYNIRKEDFVCVKVEDNGIGFENEYRDKIFGIFQRLHGRNYEGTGIGLSIAKKIVEIHGGIIDGKGELNKGATFLVILPIDGVRIEFDGHDGLQLLDGKDGHEKRDGKSGTN